MTDRVPTLDVGEPSREGDSEVPTLDNAVPFDERPTVQPCLYTVTWGDLCLCYRWL